MFYDNNFSSIAAILKSRVRSADSVTRFGLEEFAVITPHTEKKSALVLASRILEAVSDEQLAIEGSMAGVTASIGMSTFNEDAFTKEALIKTAEETLSHAKKLGKTVSVFSGAPRLSDLPHFRECHICI